MPNAIVTGGSRGLGLALITDLAADGWRVVTDGRDGRALIEATRDLPGVVAVPGDIADPAHRRALVQAAVGPATGEGGVNGAQGTGDGARIDAIVNNASLLGPSPQPHLADYPLDVLARVYAVNVLAPLGLVQAALGHLREGAVIVNITSDVAGESYPGWGGYGSAKAALEHVSRTLAAEHPDLRVYAADPGDLRTRMHQEAFPGEDISDRPLPEVAVPGLRRLLDGELASGRYAAQELGVRA